MTHRIYMKQNLYKHVKIYFIFLYFSVQITFSPNMVDVTSVDYFNVVAIGKVSKSVVKCVGSCKGKRFFPTEFV